MGKFDEIFDDVVVNAKACASAVSQKASTVYDVSKHKITAAEIRGDINKSFVNSVLLHTNLRFTEQTIHSRLSLSFRKFPI